MCARKTRILFGKPVADAILTSVRKEVATLKGRPPSVVFLRVGNDGASVSYVKQKAKCASEVGIRSETRVFDETTTEEQLLSEIVRLNKDPNVDGILVQLPLPKHINTLNILRAVDSKKDVDGFTDINCGHLWQGDGSLIPCTPAGIVEFLKYYRIATEGKQVVIVNRSSIVGKPLAALLLRHSEFGNATVTVCHSYTQNLLEITKQADILVLACGKPHAFGRDYVKEGAVVIDVGISRVPADNERGYIIQGDADVEALKGYVDTLTPVPGGIGPLTVAMLMKNTLQAYYLCQQP